MFPAFILEMKYAMINVSAQKEAFVKFFVGAIKYCANQLFMDVTVSKGIVPQIIVLALSMEENAIHKDAKIVIFKNLKKFVAKI